MRYENVLSRSVRIVLRHPWLWLLALLAGETASGGGGGGGTGFQGRFRNGNQPGPDFSWVPQWIADRSTLLEEIAVGLLLLSLIWFLLSCVAEGALIGAVARIDGGEEVRLGTAWLLGMATAWRVIRFRLLLLVLSLGPGLLLLIPPLVGATAGTSGLVKGALLDLPLAVAYLFWLAFLGLLSVLAIRACVLQGEGPIGGYRVAYRLLKARFPRIALTVVIFAVVGFGVGIVVQLIVSLVSVPFLGVLFGEMADGRWSQLPGTAALLLAVLVPVALIVSSAAGAYFATAWTVAYRRFEQEGELPEPAPLAV